MYLYGWNEKLICSETVLMGKKINETCENYSKIKIPEKYAVIIFYKSIGVWIYLVVAIWQYVGQHEWGKPLNQMMTGL